MSGNPSPKGPGERKNKYGGQSLVKKKSPTVKVKASQLTIITKNLPLKRIVITGSQRKEEMMEEGKTVDTLESPPRDPVINQIHLGQKKVDFDRSPIVEELLTQHDEPEVHWRRRSEVRVQDENDLDDDSLQVEVIYMVRHVDELSSQDRTQYNPSDSSEDESEGHKDNNHSAEDEAVYVVETDYDQPGAHYYNQRRCPTPTTLPPNAQRQRGSTPSSEGEQGGQRNEVEMIKRKVSTVSIRVWHLNPRFKNPLLKGPDKKFYTVSIGA